MQSLEDDQAFIDWFPNSSTLNVVNIITSKLLQMERIRDQWWRDKSFVLKNGRWVYGNDTVCKYDWDDQVINC